MKTIARVNRYSFWEFWGRILSLVVPWVGVMACAQSRPSHTAGCEKIAAPFGWCIGVGFVILGAFILICGVIEILVSHADRMSHEHGRVK